MRTSVALPVIHLVDERYEDIRSVEVYQCAFCRQSVGTDDLSFSDYFNTDELIQAIKDKSYEENGAIPDTVDLNTLSESEKFEGAYCEGCEKIINRDNWWGDNYVFVCPLNGCYCDSAHSALMCCSYMCNAAHAETGMSCHCTRGVKINDDYTPSSQDSELEGTHIWWCYCEGDCEYHVCLLDHQLFSSVTDATEHWADEHPEYWQPGESEEPPTPTAHESFVHSRKALEELADCEMCMSEFCCPIHDTHKIPHNACELA